MKNTEPSIPLSPRACLRFLWTGTFIVTTLYLVTQIAARISGHPVMWGLVPLCNMDVESSFPTWFSTIVLGLVAFLAWVISALPDTDVKKFKGHWRGITLLFMILSIDEVAGVHEIVGEHVHRVFDTSGLLYFGFVIPGAILAAVFFLLYIPMLLALPRRIALGMLSAGALYLSGTLVCESVGGLLSSNLGQQHFYFVLETLFEEFLELAATLWMMRTLFLYLDSKLSEGRLPIRLNRE